MSSNNSPSQSSSSPSSSPDIDSPRKLLGKQFNFVGGGIIYRCSHCRSHLALHDELISKAFHGRSGRAYLFNKVINITLGRPEDRLLSTGLHTVSDIYCIYCNESIGWFYEFAHQLTQKYKEGKYILEKQKIFQEVIHQPDQSDWKTAGEYGDIDENNNNNNNNTINYPIALSS